MSSGGGDADTSGSLALSTLALWSTAIECNGGSLFALPGRGPMAGHGLGGGNERFDISMPPLLTNSHAVLSLCNGG